VFARGLKAKMAITIAMLLFVAMVLIDLVIVVTTQNEIYSVGKAPRRSHRYLSVGKYRIPFGLKNKDYEHIR
jgi:hypothetical protein